MVAPIPFSLTIAADSLHLDTHSSFVAPAANALPARHRLTAIPNTASVILLIHNLLLWFVKRRYPHRAISPRPPFPNQSTRLRPRLPIGPRETMDGRVTPWGIRSAGPEMLGKERGHFPGQEQPDVGCANGDRPRSFDARFFDTDDAVMG